MNKGMLDDINRSKPDDAICGSESLRSSNSELVTISERTDLLEIPERREETTDKRESEVVRFNLEEIKRHFDESIQCVEKEFEIADYLLESAFDFFMHEFNKFALTSMYDEKWSQTKEYKKIQVPLELIEKVLKTGEPESWFLANINDTYKTNTMVSKTGFKKQLELMGLKAGDIALDIYPEKNRDDATKQLYESLDSLYERRNYLIHQSNRNHEDVSFYETEVSRSVVEYYTNFIKKLIDVLISKAACV